MSKHTPGPWWLGRDPSHFGSLTSITGGSDSTGGIRSVAEVGGPDIDEAEANASLIAAAPEMLDALKAMTKLYVDFVNSGDCGCWDPERIDEVKLARAVIAKAEGK